MVDLPVPFGDSAAKRNKVVLVCFGGKSSLDVNQRLFEWCSVNIVDEEDDVYVMHFTRTKKSGMSAIRTAATQRAGVTVVDIAALATKEEDSSNESKDSVRPTVPPEWLPTAVIDAASKHRSACPSSVVAIFEVDLDAGFSSAEVRRRRGARHARATRTVRDAVVVFLEVLAIGIVRFKKNDSSEFAFDGYRSAAGRTNGIDRAVHMT